MPKAPTSSTGAKRKRPTSSPSSKRRRPLKKADPSHLSIVPTASLKWKPLELPSEANAMGGRTEDDFFQGLDFDADDFMGLKEIEGVDVVREDGIVRFAVRDDESSDDDGQEANKDEAPEEEAPQPKQSKAKAKKAAKKDAKGKAKEQGESTAAEGEALAASLEKQGKAKKAVKEQKQKQPPIAAAEARPSDELAVDWNVLADRDEDGSIAFDESRLPGWSSLPLHSTLKRALHTLNFLEPTAIQAATLPHALGTRDVVGIAQTGSGKTLAYGLPVLQHIIASALKEDDDAEDGDEEEEDDDAGLAALILCPTRELALQVSKHLQHVIDATGLGRKLIGLATVTGGMSEEKQRRLLERNGGADIVVATPGRLWDLCQSDDELASRIKMTRFLVVDEADRMIEAGHFAEMENILALVDRGEEEDEEEQGPTLRTSRVSGNPAMQTLIFSATLSKELQRNLKRSNRRRRKDSASTLDDLLDAIDFRDEDPQVVDLTPMRKVAEKLKEAKVECLAKEKDLYLYYFLLRYPARTLVFLNSIDGIRRLHPLLTQLGLDVHPLHSQLQQKQRLKHLDRFKSSKTSVLLATDVAARGLDIEAIDHVVHFTLPRTADTFVHRSGRTARAGRSGLSLLLVEPAEKRLLRDLCKSLKRAEGDIAPLPIEYSFLPALTERLDLARKIDQTVHTANKDSHDQAWLKKMATEAEIELDLDENDETELSAGGRKGREAKGRAAALKAELQELLRRPLQARGVSKKYLTSGSREFVRSLLEGEQHEGLIGVRKSKAEDDLVGLGNEGTHGGKKRGAESMSGNAGRAGANVGGGAAKSKKVKKA